MRTGTFNSGMGSSWAGTFVQAVDMASQADRRDVEPDDQQRNDHARGGKGGATPGDDDESGDHDAAHQCDGERRSA